jgi:tRNA(adenine34) deaminase
MAIGSQDEQWMRAALVEAELALAHDDVPVGAVVVRKGQLIGRGHNQREQAHDPTAHAEMIALRQAANYLKRWQLNDVTLYCTLEPCCMCAGAIVLARIPRVVYGAVDPKAGCAGSIVDLLRHHQLNHQVDVDVGLMADEAANLLQTFFLQRRA